MAKGLGPRIAGKSSKGSSPTGVVAGGATAAPAKPLQSPAGKGLPIAMKRALTRKPNSSKGL